MAVECKAYRPEARIWAVAVVLVGDNVDVAKIARAVGDRLAVHKGYGRDFISGWLKRRAIL